MHVEIFYEVSYNYSITDLVDNSTKAIKLVSIYYSELEFLRHYPAGHTQFSVPKKSNIGTESGAMYQLEVATHGHQ